MCSEFISSSQAGLSELLINPDKLKLCFSARLLVCLTLLPDMGVAQIPDRAKLLLPVAVHLSGTVSDQAGHPITGVSVNHLELNKWVETDHAGYFDLRTTAPAIVFRKVGFQSVYHKNDQDDVNLNVVLRSDAVPMKRCEAAAACTSLTGFRGEFCLPQIHGVKVSKQGNNVEYGQRFFTIKTKHGKFGIQLAGGAMWGLGLPFDDQVWSAQEYTEKVYSDR